MFRKGPKGSPKGKRGSKRVSKRGSKRVPERGKGTQKVSKWGPRVQINEFRYDETRLGKGFKCSERVQKGPRRAKGDPKGCPNGGPKEDPQGVQKGTPKGCPGNK